ncbi:MAG: hypothetical protein JJU10_01795 [Idiomarina sp.]|nr:hypothetical protein [Idiomarina sp.]
MRNRWMWFVLSSVLIITIPVSTDAANGNASNGNATAQVPYLLSGDAQVRQLTRHAMFPAEGQQHQQLALSLRNQRILEQQAESRARQLQFQLQAAEALAAMRELSYGYSETENVPVSTSSAPSVPVFHADLQRFRLLALAHRHGEWTARLGYGEHILTVKHGDVLLGDVRVSFDGMSVRLRDNQAVHTLSLEAW